MAEYNNIELVIYSDTRENFESAKNEYTRIGIISKTAEFWANGEYYPLVYLNDYLKKTDAAALAKDLTGSTEATHEEFMFRPSAGDKSIRDESAVIRRIKGNTTVWGQRVKNGNFLQGISGWGTNNATLSVADVGEIVFTTTANNSQYIGQTLSSPIYKGHKVLIVLDYKRNTTSSLSTVFYLRKNSGGYDIARVNNISSNTRRVDCAFITTTDIIANNGSHSLLVYPLLNGPTGLSASIYSINIFDLTDIFGAGNEPDTYDVFKRLYPDTNYQYCAPEIRAMRSEEIETIGANTFDKYNVTGGIIDDYGDVISNDIYSVCKIEVVPKEVYTLTNVANAVNTKYTYATYDSNDLFISTGEIRNSITKPISVTGDITIPVNARYIRIIVHNDDLDTCCVNLKHSGILNASDAVYFKYVRKLPDIAKYFPDGMHGIGEVYDEINAENVVKRFGVVDLGTLEWSVTGTASGGKRFYSSAADWASRPTGGSWMKGVIKCAKYDTVSGDDTYSEKVGIALMSDGKRLQCYDPLYSDVESFKEAVSGVVLYYELLEPIVTAITEPLQLDYKVADFGTEKTKSSLPSSPFMADIIYQFNAADRIRDNARNIERIEERTKNMATMKDIEYSIPTEIATATQRINISQEIGILSMSPNVLYDWGAQTLDSITIPPLLDTDSNYDNKWFIRFALLSSDNLSIPYDVLWKDGIAPSWSEWCLCEITLFKDPTGVYTYGEWKIFK